MARSFLPLMVVAFVGCADDTSSTGGSGGAGGDGTGASGGAPAGGDGAGGASGGSAPEGGGGSGGGSCYDTSTLEYGPGPTGEPGCLTVAGANAFCGFGSDEVICNFSVGCDVSSDLGQCQINCEQGSSSFCNDAAAVECVVSAYCNDDCDALAGCSFIL